MIAASGDTELDLEDGEIFDEEESRIVDQKKKSPSSESPPLVSIKADSGCSFKRRPSPSNAHSPNRQKKSKDRKSHDGKGEKKNERDCRLSGGPPPKRSKRGRDSEEEYGKPKMRRPIDSRPLDSPVEDEVDENEMIYVRGGNSPSQGNHTSDWENRLSDEEAGGVDRGNRPRRGNRRGFDGNRNARRNRFARGGKNRNPRPNKMEPRGEFALCKFFMQGNCQRGNDCPFSHDALPPKKMELCKFFMNDCCSKKDKCLFMHQDFPCKFFHSGLKCYAGKKCKFYHGKINNFLRQVLNKHLETCDLRAEHEKMRLLFESNEGRNTERKSRFSDRNEQRSFSPDGEEEGHTPMPSPQPNHFSDREAGSLSPPEKNEKLRKEDLRKDDGFKKEAYRKKDEFRERGFVGHSVHGRDNRRNRKRRRFNDFDRNNSEVGGGFYNDEFTVNNEDYAEDYYEDQGDYLECENQQKYPEEMTQHQPIQNFDEHEDIPANLPKTQRNLFMRIQHQMKKSESKPKENVTRDDEFKEENWYSSDEEADSHGSKHSAGNPLSTIYSNVPGLKRSAEQSSPPNSGSESQVLDGSYLPNPQMFPDIDVNAITKLLSTVREIQQKSAEGGTKGDPKLEKPPISNQQSPNEEKRSRDPRLRTVSQSSQLSGGSSAPPPGAILLTQADLDLRRSSPVRTSSDNFMPPQSMLDVDLRNLPFKPAPEHQAANEICASINSGPPIEWNLKLLPPIGPDYSFIASRMSAQTCLNDPRLKKHMQPQVLAQSQQVVMGPGGMVSMPITPGGNILSSSPQPMMPPIGGNSPGGPLIPPPIQAGPSMPPIPPPMMGPMMAPGGPMVGLPVPIQPPLMMASRDPRQRSHGPSAPEPAQSKGPLINDPRRKPTKTPDCFDNDLRNLSPAPLHGNMPNPFSAFPIPPHSDTDLRLAPRPQPFYQ